MSAGSVGSVGSDGKVGNVGNVGNEETIARLEGLLERVRSRAAEPRAPRQTTTASTASTASVAAQLHTPTLAPPVVRGPSTVPPAVPVPIASPAAEVSSVEVSASELVEVYPSEDDLDAEVSSEVVEVDIDVDDVEVEPIQPRSDTQSGAQRVAESASLEVEEEAASELAGEVRSERASVAPANELEEEHPASSRRPVVNETSGDMDLDAPRHTPPPESGRQVSGSLAPAGHVTHAPQAPEVVTGGWREPGLVAEPVPASARAPRTLDEPAAAGAQPVASAETIEPVLPAATKVARIVSAPPSFAPRSFGELLDATLSL